jgi:hypothetical protein
VYDPRTNTLAKQQKNTEFVSARATLALRFSPSLLILNLSTTLLTITTDKHTSLSRTRSSNFRPFFPLFPYLLRHSSFFLLSSPSPSNGLLNVYSTFESTTDCQ